MSEIDEKETPAPRREAPHSAEACPCCSIALRDAAERDALQAERDRWAEIEKRAAEVALKSQDLRARVSALEGVLGEMGCGLCGNRIGSVVHPGCDHCLPARAALASPSQPSEPEGRYRCETCDHAKPLHLYGTSACAANACNCFEYVATAAEVRAERPAAPPPPAKPVTYASRIKLPPFEEVMPEFVDTGLYGHLPRCPGTDCGAVIIPGQEPEHTSRCELKRAQDHWRFHR